MLIGSAAAWFRFCFISVLPEKCVMVNVVSEEVRYYKGKHKVKILSQSRGNWVVEALEAFEDVVNGERVNVSKGERRIVAPNLLFFRKSLAPPVKEHVYELKMEKKLKKLIEKEEERAADKRFK